ncbi:MAG: PD-(D/E)XK nuclease family protein [Elusimicrobiota bacterium]|jgi:DNA helicase-2/ATP-dependent DNA helicase PcrA|nr:PD-(D/E)XK nuclease family protein [Elusimicrobiota bacterium]
MIPQNPRELNYSKVKTYRECPYLYKLKYTEGRKEGLTPATSLGVSIHRTLDDYHSHSSDPGEIMRYYNANFLCAGFGGAGEQMEYYLKGQRMLKIYEQREHERKSAVDATEREFMFDYEGWTIRGKIDRIDRLEDDSWEVIDYKTDAQLEENYDITSSLQLGVYSIGARRAWNLKKGKATVYFVALDKKISAGFDSFNEREILDIFTAAGEAIEARKFAPDTKHCPRCLMNNRCPYSSVKRQEAA